MTNAARARKSTRRAFVLACAVCCGAAACASSSAAPSPRAASHASAPSTRVLFIGDSVLDQEGGAAAFLLRQRGIDAVKVAFWGSGLYTRDQYDLGRTILTASGPANPVDWLTKAAALITQYRPELVVVAMNHNHPSPYPRDAKGNDIVVIASAAGRAMVASQTNALIDILERDGAQVVLITGVQP